MAIGFAHQPFREDAQIQKDHFGSGFNAQMYHMGETGWVARVLYSNVINGRMLNLGFDDLWREKDYYDLLKKYLGDYVPEAFFLLADGREGGWGKTAMCITRKVERPFTPISTLSPLQIMSSTVRDQLIDIAQRTLYMIETEHVFPDFSGNWDNIFSILRSKNFILTTVF